MFKIKDGYKLELQMPETIKLFGKQKKKKNNRQSKEWRKCTSECEEVRKCWSGWGSFSTVQFSR